MKKIYYVIQKKSNKKYFAPQFYKYKWSPNIEISWIFETRELAESILNSLGGKHLYDVVERLVE